MKLPRLRQLLREHWTELCYLLALAALMLIPATVSPVFRKVFTDDVLQKNAREWLPTLLMVMAFVSLFSAMLMLLQQLVQKKLANKIELMGASAYIYRLLRSPLSLFTGADPTALLGKANDAKAVSGIATTGLVSSIFTLINLGLYFVLMWRLDWTMALAVVALVALSYAFSRLETKLVAAMTKRAGAVLVTSDAGTLAAIDNQIASKGLQSIETIKSTSGETRFFQRLMGVKVAAVHARRSADYGAAAAPLNSLPQMLFMNLLLLVAALRIMDQRFTVGTYLAFQAYAAAFFGPMGALIGLRKQVKGYEGTLANYDTQLKKDDDAAFVQARTALRGHKLSGHVRLSNVTFGYVPEKPVLKDISLEVRPGQRVAILGPSGAGKSTLIKLIQGLYAPDAGEVLLDGEAVGSIDPTALQASVGSANQSISIFTATMRDNIALWDDSASEADIFKASTDAQLHEYVASLEGAYQYMLAENGRNLSGGQKQRLEIARALLGSPSLVLLDEVTSSLDPGTADSIQQALIRRGCAVLAVTHVVASVRDYDQIIILMDGQIQAVGTHEQLLKKSEYYASLYQAEGWMPT